MRLQQPLRLAAQAALRLGGTRALRNGAHGIQNRDEVKCPTQFESISSAAQTCCNGRKCRSGIRGQTKYGSEVLRVPAEHRDGHSLSIAFTVTLLELPEGRGRAIAAIMRDETARWNEERDLRRRLADLEAKGACASRLIATQPRGSRRCGYWVKSFLICAMTSGGWVMTSLAID